MDCIIRTLKTSADNNNLPVYGELKLKIKAGTFKQFIRAETSDNCEVSGGTGISFKSINLSNSYTNPFQLTSIIAYGFNVIASQESYVTISNKYVLNCLLQDVGYKFGFDGVSDIDGGVKEIIVPSNTKFFYFANSTMPIDIKEIADMLDASNIESLEKISLEQHTTNNKLTGIISSLARQGLKNIDISGNTNISGDIVSLGGITTLENIAIHNSKVSGTIESFVAAQRAAGRTTGSVSGNSAGWGNVTFNGSTTNAKGSVSWTATTITMNGVTIDA